MIRYGRPFIFLIVECESVCPCVLLRPRAKQSRHFPNLHFSAGAEAMQKRGCADLSALRSFSPLGSSFKRLQASVGKSVAACSLCFPGSIGHSVRIVISVLV